VQRAASTFLGDVTALSLVGYDQAKGRGVYTVVPVDRRARDVEGTRWRMQLGARFTF
jgi:hypothetical protein